MPTGARFPSTEPGSALDGRTGSKRRCLGAVYSHSCVQCGRRRHIVGKQLGSGPAEVDALLVVGTLVRRQIGPELWATGPGGMTVALLRGGGATRTQVSNRHSARRRLLRSAGALPLRQACHAPNMPSRARPDLFWVEEADIVAGAALAPSGHRPHPPGPSSLRRWTPLPSLAAGGAFGAALCRP